MVAILVFRYDWDKMILIRTGAILLLLTVFVYLFKDYPRLRQYQIEKLTYPFSLSARKVMSQ